MIEKIVSTGRPGAERGAFDGLSAGSSREAAGARWAPLWSPHSPLYSRSQKRSPATPAKLWSGMSATPTPRCFSPSQASLCLRRSKRWSSPACTANPFCTSHPEVFLTSTIPPKSYSAFLMKLLCAPPCHRQSGDARTRCLEMDLRSFGNRFVLAPAPS